MTNPRSLAVVSFDQIGDIADRHGVDASLVRSTGFGAALGTLAAGLVSSRPAATLVGAVGGSLAGWFIARRK